MADLRLNCDLARDAGHADVDERQDGVALTAGLVTPRPNPGHVLLHELVVDRDFLHDELNARVVPQALLTNSNSNLFQRLRLTLDQGIRILHRLV